MLPAMAAKPSIAIVGAGRLGSALATALVQARYKVTEIVARNERSRRKARAMARTAGAKVRTMRDARLRADLVWFCVPDRQIANVATALESVVGWKGKIAFHASGALASDELGVLRRRGATVASVHPFMTFVAGSSPSLTGVPFALEGDAVAVRVARRIVHDLGASSFLIRKKDKALYHAWGAFGSPLIVAALVTAEKVATAAGLTALAARKKMLPILRQTIENYAKLGPAGALSGPLVRGDTEVVERHLKVLKKVPEASEVYVALSRSASRHLPVRRRNELRTVLKS
jgi:predicted short-subunit dehydrogenase-like oxidoreductase (DUF2520 family)